MNPSALDERPAWRPARRPLLGLVAGCAGWFLVSGYTLTWLILAAPGKFAWDYLVYLAAYHKAASGLNPYAPFHIGQGFLNHPFTLSLVGGLAGHLGGIRSALVWSAISALTWVLAIGLALRWARKARSLAGSWPLSPWVVAILALFWAPAVEMFYVGQVDSFVLLAMLLCLTLLEAGHDLSSGLCLALAMVLKSSPVLFLAYLLSVRRPRAMAGALLGWLGFSLGAVLQFFPRIMPEYGRTIVRLGSEIHSGVLNQSPLAMTAGAVTALGWPGLDGYLIGTQRVAVVSITAALVVVIHRRPSLSPAEHIQLFALFTTLMVLFSPLSWYHHEIFLLLPCLVLVVHARGRIAWMGSGLACLIQAERVLNSLGIPVGLPSLMAQIGMAGLLWSLYVRRPLQMPPICGGRHG